MKNNGILQSALSMSISAILVKVLGVLYKVPLSYILGEAGLGYFNTAYSIYGLFYVLMSGGVPKALTLTIAKLKAEGNENIGYSLYTKILKISGIISLFIALILVIYKKEIAVLMGNSSSESSIMVIAPAIVFIFIGCVARGYLHAYLKLGTIGLSQVIEALLKVVLGVLLSRIGLYLGASNETISSLAIVGLTIGSGISSIYMLIYVKIHNKKNNKGQNTEISTKVVKSFLGLLAPLTTSSLVLAIGSFIEVPIILRGLRAIGYSETEASAAYGIYSTLALPMLSAVVALLAPISAELLPKLVSTGGKFERDKLFHLFSSAIKKTCLLVIPIVLALLLYGFEILDILFDHSQAYKGFDLICSLLLTIALQPIFNLLIATLEGLGRTAQTIIVSLVTVTIKAFLMLYTVSDSSIGIKGIGISITIAYSVGTFLALILLNNTKIVECIIQTLVDYIVFGSVSFIPSYLILYCTNISGSGVFSAILSGAVGLIVYCFLIASRVAVFRNIKAK